MKTFLSAAGRRSTLLRLALAAAGVLHHQVQSYVVGSGPTSELGILSRFDVECELLMTVGRTPQTAMPPEWAASGAKLGLPLRVKFTPEATSDATTEHEALLGGALPSSLAVQPLNEPSFVSAKGQETVKVTSGRGSCQMQIPDTQQYSLRFFLEFPEGAARNDVVLPAERIYFMTACWDEDNHMMELAKTFKEDAASSMAQVEAKLETMNAPSKGMMEKMSGFRRYLSLLEDRNKLAAKIAMLEDAFPPDDRLVKSPNNMAFLKEGVIAVKRFQEEREVFHWVGTFTMRKVLENVVADDEAS